MAQCIKLMFAIAIFITYALQAYVPVEIIWSTYLDHHIKKNKLFWEYICRTFVTLVTCESIFFLILIENICESKLHKFV